LDSWLERASKRDIIDLCFIGRVKIKAPDGVVESLLSFIKREIEGIMGLRMVLRDRDLLDNHLVMLFIKDSPRRWSRPSKSAS